MCEWCDQICVKLEIGCELKYIVSCKLIHELSNGSIQKKNFILLLAPKHLPFIIKITIYILSVDRLSCYRYSSTIYET